MLLFSRITWIGNGRRASRHLDDRSADRTDGSQVAITGSPRQNNTRALSSASIRPWPGRCGSQSCGVVAELRGMGEDHALMPEALRRSRRNSYLKGGVREFSGRFESLSEFDE
jgi:hypothetical protein